MTMKIQHAALFDAIKNGDLAAVQSIVEACGEEELHELLTWRLDDVITIRRPSNGKEILVRRPTALALAVTQWYPEIVSYICTFRIAINAESVVEDLTYKQKAYGAVTSLHLASISGKVAMTKSLLESGADPNKKNDIGATPLFEACAEGHNLVVEYLLDHSADPDIANNQGTTCAMIAAFSDNSDVIKALVHKGANLTGVDKDGRNVLFYSVGGGKLDSLLYLLDNGARVQTDAQEVTLLMEAAFRNQVEIVRYFIHHRRNLNMRIHETDSAGRNALFYLAESKNTKLFELLLRSGVRLVPANDGRTVLMVAALRNNHCLVNYLLANSAKYGVDVNERDKKGRNVMFYCITGGDIDLLRSLIDYSARMDVSAEGITPLMQAVAKHRLNFILYLLAGEEDSPDPQLQAQDKDGWNAVFYAVASGHLDVLEMLVETGARAEEAIDGRTILMQAVLKGRSELVRYILDNARELDIYVNQRDKDGWTALWYTIPGCRLDILDLLVQRGAQLTAAMNGTTVLHEAVDKGKYEMVVYLVDSHKTLGLDLAAKDNHGSNATMYAAATGNLKILKVLINGGLPLEPDKYGRTILMHACVGGSIEVVRYLTQNSALLQLDVQARDQESRNALFYSIDGGSIEILDHLVCQGVKPETDRHGRSLLMQAARGGQAELVEYLLDHAEELNVNINTPDMYGENALFYACRANRLAIVHMLLQNGVEVVDNKYGVNILPQCMADQSDQLVQAIFSSPVDLSKALNGKDTKGRSVYHHCIMRGDLELLHKIGKHFDPKKDADVDGLTSSMKACYANNIEVLKYVVENLKADITLRDSGERDTLFHSVEASNIEAVKYLLDIAKEHNPDINGRTILMVTAQTGNTKIAELLLRSRFGRDLMHSKDNYGLLAAHYCALEGRQSVLSILDRFKCILDDQDKGGATPVMYAAERGHVTTLGFLLRKGASVDTLDAKNQNALHYCFKKYPSVRCIKLLVKFDIDVNQQDIQKTTPLMMVCKSWSSTNISTIKFLMQHGADPVIQDTEGKDSFDHCPWNAEYVKELMRQSSGNVD